MFSFFLGLSKWIRQQIQHHDNFGSALESLHAFTVRNQKGIGCSSECNEILRVPSHSKDLSQASQQEATVHLSPDVPAKTEEQTLVSEISSVSPTAPNLPSKSMATMKQSMFISCRKTSLASNFKWMELHLFWKKQIVFKITEVLWWKVLIFLQVCMNCAQKTFQLS